MICELSEVSVCEFGVGATGASAAGTVVIDWFMSDETKSFILLRLGLASAFFAGLFFLFGDFLGWLLLFSLILFFCSFAAAASEFFCLRSCFLEVDHFERASLPPSKKRGDYYLKYY